MTLRETKLMIIFYAIHYKERDVKRYEDNTMNLYIESLEGGNYLASTGTAASRTLVRDNKSQPKTFHCINEIREHFDSQPFEQVWLRQNTPYEEMVGQHERTSPLNLEIEW